MVMKIRHMVMELKTDGLWLMDLHHWHRYSHDESNPNESRCSENPASFRDGYWSRWAMAVLRWQMQTND
jgi:hypothetical protein